MEKKREREIQNIKREIKKKGENERDIGLLIEIEK